MSKENLRLDQKLILNRYILNKIGFREFEDIQAMFKNISLEEIDERGNTKFILKLLDRVEDREISDEELLEYDSNIVSWLRKINFKRIEPIRLKYFQYFSLLFVEIYLDNYFGNRYKLLKELNNLVKEFNIKYSEKITQYEESDLNKLALWSATGSGKTILMHINYYQILHYIYKYKKEFDGSYILLSPSEGLSEQHRIEYEKSNIRAKRYNKDDSKIFSNKEEIEILEPTKLGEKDLDETVAVSRFGSENIIFVDEGHRGTSGDVWYKYRNKLCLNGFSFEYSATFGQAIEGASNKKNRENLIDEYSKCIYFDYSYRYFYNDGYGKDYDILNLKTEEESIKNIYLTASLLSFYQQKKVYSMYNSDFKEFNIENPLMIFVGASVNAVRSENKKDVSDVVDVLLFINQFINDENHYKEIIDRILNGKTGLLDENNSDVFQGKFDFLLNLDRENIYKDMIYEIFHETISGSNLYLENLKGIDGEIQLRLGDNEPFGVINVGDDSKLIKLCEDNGLETGELEFSKSLFQEINSQSSSINILIGSKKFTEGWNSWRVSSMGLMNIGKTEGSQIIQLFGRGVRLKGKGMSLKRSQAYFIDYPFEKNPDNYRFLKYLETLTIFGVKADYMQQFKEYLMSEGINIDKKPLILEIPILKQDNLKNIITIKPRNNINFKKNGPLTLLTHDDEFIIDLDCYGRVQFESSIKIRKKIVDKEVNYFEEKHLLLLDYDRIYYEIQNYKMEKNYNNIILNKEFIKKLLKDRKWYRLYIQNEDMVIKSVEDLERFNRIAVSLIKKYIDKKYYILKSKWETPFLEYSYMDKNDNNFVNGNSYEMEIKNQEDNLIYLNFIEDIKRLIESNFKAKSFLEFKKEKGDLGIISLNQSLYNPYIFLSRNNIDIKVNPIAINESEWKFIGDLKDHLINNSSEFKDKDIYLIRNVSKSGIGFFEKEGFYPDFILWIITKDNYYINFIEPHGMKNEDLTSGKVQLYEKLKQYQKTIDNTKIGGRIPILNSFILSWTKYLAMTSKYTENQWNENNVLFMESTNYIEDMFYIILNN